MDGLNELSEFMGTIWGFIWRKILKMCKYDYNVKVRSFGPNELCMNELNINAS